MLKRWNVIAAAVTALTLSACAQGELTVNGEPRPVTEIESTLADDALNINVLSDPQPNAIDDELTIQLALTIADINALELNAGHAIDGEAISGSFSYSCLCGPVENSEEPSLSGTLTLFERNEQKLKGEISVTLKGKDANDNDVGTVELTVPFET
jgi:hypothetical protein